MSVPAIDLNHPSDQLRELVEDATRAGEIVLTRGGEAVAKISPIERVRKPRRPGSARGLIHMADE